MDHVIRGPGIILHIVFKIAFIAMWDIKKMDIVFVFVCFYSTFRLCEIQALMLVGFLKNKTLYCQTSIFQFGYKLTLIQLLRKSG